LRLKAAAKRKDFGSFAAVSNSESVGDAMRTLQSELDERLDDFGQTVGRRITSVERETGDLRDELRDELRSEIGEVRRGLRLLLIAVILALVGVLATLLVELL